MRERRTFISFGTHSDPSIDYLVGILEDARVTTLHRVEGISDEELHWQFTEGWNTVGALLSHIIACEEYFRIFFVERRDFSPAESDQWTPGLELGQFVPRLITGEPIGGYIEKLEQSRAKLLDAIRTLDTAKFREKRVGYNPNTGFNLGWVLYHLSEDEVHHRGQISILRKLYKTQQHK
jgi:uncharacterized damage-inducible protein DinB